MTLATFLLWIGSVLCDTVGQIAFKFAAVSPNNRSSWYYWLDILGNYWIWLGVSVYIVGLLFWVAFLTLMPLSQAILLGSANIITVMLVGRVLFKEQLTPLRIIGTSLITLGVILVGIS